AAQLGCLPLDVAWSPDDRRLAYGCGSTFGPTGHSRVLFSIDPEGRERKAIPTGTAAAFSPSWSPDGSRIVFATAARPTQVVAVHPPGAVHSNPHGVGVHA